MKEKKHNKQMQCYTCNKLNKCRCTLKTKDPSHESKLKKLCLAVQNTKFTLSAPQNISKDGKKNEQKNADVIYGLYSSKSQEYLRKKTARRKINRVKKKSNRGQL